MMSTRHNHGGSVATEGEETEAMRDRKLVALFMAFGTKGDIFPVAALAAAFACDQKQYKVSFITHSAHQGLTGNLAAKDVTFIPISSPPVLAAHQHEQISDSRASSGGSDSEQNNFSLWKRMIEAEHRKECLAAIERIFANDLSKEGDFIAINFFALEGWHLAELFQVRCIVTAPYVVPYSAPSSFEYRFKKDLPLLYKYFQEAPVGTVGWKDVLHWMWPLFMEIWGSWRNDILNLSSIPFMVQHLTPRRQTDIILWIRSLIFPCGTLGLNHHYCCKIHASPKVWVQQRNCRVPRLLATKCMHMWLLVSTYGMAILMRKMRSIIFE